MASITATFPTLTFGQRGVQTRDDFVATQEAGQDTLSGAWATQAELFKTETNAVKVEVSTLRDTAVASATSATSSKDTATTKADEASVFAASALASKNAIDAKVIPTEATYNYDYIDSASNARDLENFLDFKF